MAYRSNLVLAMAVAGVAMAIVLLDFAPPPIRIAATLPLVILLPGYALTSALFARQTTELPIGLLLSVGLSLAITILEGLLLNLTPWGLQATSWALALGGTILIALCWRFANASHARTRFVLDADGLRIRRGVFWHSETLVPRSRVQHIDLNRGPLDRRFGLASLIGEICCLMTALVLVPAIVSLRRRPAAASVAV